ncbi:hypothetical protein VTI74DRAFT_1321 [Chaetomium olivicolor]
MGLKRKLNAASCPAWTHCSRGKELPGTSVLSAARSNKPMNRIWQPGPDTRIRRDITRRNPVRKSWHSLGRLRCMCQTHFLLAEAPFFTCGWVTRSGLSEISLRAERSSWRWVGLEVGFNLDPILIRMSRPPCIHPAFSQPLFIRSPNLLHQVSHGALRQANCWETSNYRNGLVSCQAHSFFACLGTR